MRRVTGIGGVFFKSKDPEKLRHWYHQHLGIEIDQWGGCVFDWKNDQNPTGEGTTVFSIFSEDADYFNSGKSSFMINFRVENLDELLELLRAEGCTLDPKVEDSEYGKFGWVIDPDGNKIELWQPPKNQ